MAENPEVLLGDCRAILPTLEAGSVQCCVTSPPYWGLRDYGTAQWEGGEVGCDHYPPRCQGETGQRADRTFTAVVPYRDICGKCGARRIDSQFGLEATPEEYIANMVAVFREVKRVLKDDGTLWVNLGDSYFALGATGGTFTAGKHGDHGLAHVREARDMQLKSARNCGLKPKDLCGIPWRLAFALQADGWYLRSDIIWAKPNPMPESVTDRPTKAHEYIFLLTKAERYFYDAEAIREPQIDPFRKDKTGWGKVGDSNGMSHYSNRDNQREYNPDGRNKRSVWTIATQPYAEAHFATFPEKIPQLCVLAGSKPGDVVLDPFAGSGTVGQVALELGRRAILIELNPAYIELARDRTFVAPGFF